MPLSKEKDRERKRLQFQPNSNLNPIPDVKPNSNLTEEPYHCSMPNCIKCHPENYQPEFKRMYGHYDLNNKDEFPIP